MIKNFQDLLSLFDQNEPIYIQAHNFPDHDGICSAFGLQQLLEVFGYRSTLIYEGEIQRDSLKETIRLMEIPVFHASEVQLQPHDKIILVDGCKGNSNVTDLIGREVAIIDHHNTVAPSCVQYADIRSHYGATATIIFEYFQQAGVAIPKSVATALLIAINMDTALLTRGVSEFDLKAYLHLYELADIQKVNSILRNYIQTRDLHFYQEVLKRASIIDGFAFSYFPDGCNQNLLGILGDFFLSLKEVDFVVLCAKNDSVVNFSIRSEHQDWDASVIIQKALDGIGFGGGHSDMAGGLIKQPELFDEHLIYHKFLSELGIEEITQVWGELPQPAG